MTENEKIQNIIDLCKGLIESTDMDISHSLKDVWYFSRFNEEFGYYDCLVRFQTAEELRNIILGELSMDLNAAMEKEPGEIPYENVNYGDDVSKHVDYDKYIDILLEQKGYQKGTI